MKTVKILWNYQQSILLHFKLFFLGIMLILKSAEMLHLLQIIFAGSAMTLTGNTSRLSR